MFNVPTSSVDRRRRRWYLAVAALGSTAVLGCGHARAQNTASATGSAIVLASGVRTGNNGINYFNVDGTGTGSTNESFGVLDFSASSFNLSSTNVSGVQGGTITLKLTESNTTYSAAGPLEFYLATNNATSIVAGTSALKFQSTTATGTNDPPYGIDPLLGALGGGSNGTLYDLGSNTYTPQTPNYQTDTYTLTLSASAMQAFANSLSSAGGGDIRLVVAATSASAEATFSGYNTSFTTERPMLSFTPVFSTANNLYWRGGNGTWTTAGTNFNTTNVSPAATAWNNDGAHVAAFAEATGSTVAVGAGLQAAGLEFDTTGYTLNAATAGNTLALTGATPAITVTNAGDIATVNVGLTGTAGMNKLGAGTLVLGGTNTYTGGTTLSTGTLQIGTDANLGDASGAVTLNGGTLHPVGSLSTGRAFGGTGGGIQVDSGATLTANGVLNVANLTLPGAGTLVLANSAVSLGGSASNAVTGTVTFTTAGGTLNATDGSGNAGQGIINLGGVAATQASGAVTLNALANVTGTVTVAVPNSGATLNLPSSLGGAAVIAKTGAGTLVLGGDNSTLSGSGTTTAVSFRQGTAGATPASGGVVSIPASNPNPGAALGTGVFDANGGTVSNDTGAPVTLAISAISVGAQNAVGTPGGLVFAGSGANPAITVTGGISLYKAGTNAYQHTITANVPTVFTGLFSVSAAGTSLGVVFAGSSTLTLAGTTANTFTEPVTIATSGANAGVIAAADGSFAQNTSITLNVGARLTISTGVMSGTADAINNAALVSFAASGGQFGKLTLNIGSAQESVGGLYLAATDGTLPAGYLPAGTYGSSQSNATYKDNTLFSGTGVLFNAGTAVPEPSALVAALAGMGLAVMRLARRKQRD